MAAAAAGVARCRCGARQPDALRARNRRFTRAAGIRDALTSLSEVNASQVAPAMIPLPSPAQ